MRHESKCLNCEQPIEVTGLLVGDTVICDNCKSDFSIVSIEDYGFGLEFELFKSRWGD